MRHGLPLPVLYKISTNKCTLAAVHRGEYITAALRQFLNAANQNADHMYSSGAGSANRGAYEIDWTTSNVLACDFILKFEN